MSFLKVLEIKFANYKIKKLKYAFQNLNVCESKYRNKYSSPKIHCSLVRYLKVTSISLQWVKSKSFISERSLQ